MNMKSLSLVAAMTIACGLLLAQAPDGFNYQAVLRDAEGQLRAEEQVTLEVAIRQGESMDNPLYTESHTVTTNPLGLVTLTVGAGTSGDDFGAIDWGAGPYFVTISVDGVEFGTSQLLSVPYAKYADRAGNVFSGDYGDLSNSPDLSAYVSIAGAAEAGNLISYDGSNWVAKDLVLEPAGGGQAFDVMPPFQAVNYCIALQGIYPSRNSADPLLGEIMLFAGNFAPRGWALCNGQLLAISQNQALFSILGTTYGGDGRTTFALPDLRGRLPMHAGSGPGLTPRRLGEMGGAETRTLNINQLPAHTHDTGQ